MDDRDVALVLDDALAEALASADRLAIAWVADTPAQRALERALEERVPAPQVTWFAPVDVSDPSVLIELLVTIEDHHGP